ncbi:CHASE3 domain-containing protein [Actinomadura sp. DC4]|uniref:CHASE3 domain-containing protein n=1 Tax=Actinomadura sp. DC4 TaxID=3055069 RepID=UPI0025B1BD34|nr:CHASE3 domain-containing protein [Actinomadura sp. DC4]MDN3352755.1 CHASE3 domain-containing protein [Actinomadura sp. DC4]
MTGWLSRRSQLRVDAPGGLSRRLVIASALLALLMAATFLILFGAIAGLRNAAALTGRSEEVLSSANRLERLIVDLETGERGYIITHDESFLTPWETARAILPDEAADFRRLGAEINRYQGRRAALISESVMSYLQDYSVPLVAKVRAQNPGVKTTPAVADGQRRLNRIRVDFDQFVDVQRRLASGYEQRSLEASRRAMAMAGAAAIGSFVLVFLFTSYLTRALVRPVRRASIMAGDLARGELGVCMPETSLGEIGVLERAFNTMARSLQLSHAKLRRVADEQAALRRVATLVARAVSPHEVFEAVATELGRILGADFIVIIRFEPDRMETVVGSWKPEENPEPAPPVGSCWSLEGRSLESVVERTGRPARMTDYQHATSGIGVWARTRGIQSGAGSPVVVEGRLWGVMIAFSATGEPQPEGIESRMIEYTELVGTAIANAESRAKLTAARARLVAASDETRRRIERDLHDGAQQRLVSLGLELRAAEASVPDGHEVVRDRIGRTVTGLAGVLEDLQDISRGLHPAILSKGGLQPAIKAFARRAAVPVELNLHAERRLEERLEVAVYYIVAEAVTNAIRHADASVVRIRLDLEDDGIRLLVEDDGVGGAAIGGGSGLIGLKDRVEALGGVIEVESPSGKGTSIHVRIPLWDR